MSLNITIGPLACVTGTYEYSYTPPFAVEMCHNIPHLLTDLSTGPSNFTEVDSMGSYLTSVAGIPLVIFVLVIVSLLIFQFVLMLRCCCTCAKCGPAMYTTKKIPGWQMKLTKHRRFIFTLYYVFLFLAFAANHALFFGNAELTKGVDSTGSTFEFLYETTSDLINVGDAIGDYVNDLSTDLAQSGCFGSSESNTAANYISDVGDNIHDFIDQIDGFPNQFLNARDDMYHYAKDQKDLVIFIFYGFVDFVLLIFCLCPLFQLRILLQITIAFTELIILAFTAVCSVQMIVVVRMTLCLCEATADCDCVQTILADFCMEPTKNLLSLLGGTMKETMQYYTQCIGTNPLKDPLNIAKSALEDLAQSVETMYNYNNPYNQCYRDPHIASMADTIADIAGQMDIISCELSCDNIAPQWFETLNTGFCTEFFTGRTAVIAVCLCLTRRSCSS